MNVVSDIWLFWESLEELSWLGGQCILLVLICYLMAIMPSFFLLGILAFSFQQIRFVLAPLAASRSWVLSTDLTARVQYFCVLIWELMSIVKLISSRNWLLVGTSSGVSLESLLIFFSNPSNCLLWRYPWCLSWRGMFLHIHCECVIWRILLINCLVQSEPLR